MGKNLRLQVVLNAVDKLTKPFRIAQASNKKLAGAIRLSREALKNLNQQIGQIDGFRKTKQQLSDTQQAYQTATQRITTLTREFNSSEAPTRKQAAALRKAQREAAQLKNKFGELQQSVQRQRSELQANGISTNQLAQAQRRLSSDIARTTQQLQRQEQQLHHTAEQERRIASARNRYQKTLAWRNKIADSGAAITASGVGVLYGAKRSLLAGFNFEKGMSKVQALSRLSNHSPELKALTEQARQLGATTSFTANDVAGGMSFLSMAGYDADKIKQAIPAMLDLAKAAEMDDSLAEVADIASNIQSAYKIPTEEMKRVADVLTYGFTTSNTTLRMLGETMKYVGPAAQVAGQNFEAMVASVGLLGNVGIQGNQAGTSLRAALFNLASQPKRAQKALEELGISIADHKGQMKEMPQILSDIAKSFSKMGIAGKGNIKKIALVKDIFGVESSSAILELLDKQSEIDPEKRIDAYAKQLKKQTNTANQVAQIKANNLDGDVRNLISAFEDVAITIYNEIRQPLRDIANKITEITRKVGDWAKQNPEIVKWVTVTTLGLAALFSVLGGISLMIAALIGPLAIAKLSLSILGIKGSGFLSLLLKPIKLVGSAIAWLARILLTNPIILIITAIATAAYLIYQYWQDIVPFCQRIWDNIANYTAQKWAAIKESISHYWHEIVGDIQAIGIVLKEAGSNIIAQLNAGITAEWAAIKATFSNCWHQVVNQIAELGASFKASGEKIIDSLQAGIVEKWQLLKAKFAEIKQMATNLLPDWLLSDEAKTARAINQITVIKAGMKSAGMFDSGGRIPRGQFGIVGEHGAEIVEGPARVTSRRNTANMAMAAAITLSTLSPPASAKSIHPYAVNSSGKHTAKSSQPIAAPVINIYPQPSQSAQDIGREVARQIEAYYRRQQAAQRSQYQDSED